MATRTCRTCGGKIAAGAAFCTSCGAPAPATTDAGTALLRDSATPPTQANTGCWKWGAGILFGVAGLIMAVLFGGAWYMGAFNPIDFNKLRASPNADGAEQTNTFGNKSVGPSVTLDGRWDVTFTAGNVQYSGEFVVSNGSGTLTVTYVGPHGPMRVREECQMAGAERVTVRCRNAQVLSGREEYSPDNFELTRASNSSMSGRMVSENGDSGTAIFTRQ